MKNACHTFLIDDDEDDRYIFELAIKDMDQGIIHSSSASGYEALNKIKNEPEFTPDFIFLDLNMPLIGGKECLAEIRKIERLKEVPVYIYSSFLQPPDAEKLRDAGARAYIAKPADIKELSRILTRILNINEVESLYSFEAA